MKDKRCIIIVLDGVGIGALPDADQYGDSGSHTLAHTAEAVGGLQLPHLQALGLGNIDRLKGMPPSENPQAAYGKMTERSEGKDSSSGHWEIGGVISATRFPVYPEGFPPEIVTRFSEAIRRGILGNKTASGTEIIAELGQEHCRTGKPIVYTSADSVFQIAAHEEVYPVGELYEICRVARRILTGDHAVCRVIARPFIGSESSGFVRTSRRRDFSLPPPNETVLEAAQKAGIPTYGIGKTDDLFAGVGLGEVRHTASNKEGIEETIQSLEDRDRGLIFVNLVETDMLWGHRRNPVGFYQALQKFDHALPDLISRLSSEDMLILTADHGVDPTAPGSDHTREYVPLLVYGQKAIDLGIRKTFADVGASVGEFFGIPYRGQGDSFWQEIYP
ncbi:MAG: phosphopentomutase [Candidatus Cloacimonetes bacterium 4572_55]|nr:MAG: phosphopentomutase [Candidatus Cloacimonetes bacterium 4572_55]